MSDFIGLIAITFLGFMGCFCIFFVSKLTNDLGAQIVTGRIRRQAATGGQPIKTIQAQLGHRSSRSTDRYAHLSNGAQLRLVESLEPEAPPHQHRHVPLTSPCSRGGKR